MNFLEHVKTGKINRKKLIMIYGPEGVGKSTFGSQFPSPIFLGSENGTDQLDVARLPPPKDWGEVLSMVNELATEKHPYETLVIDTLDWLEPIMHNHVLGSDQKKPKVIEDAGGGYGRWVSVVNKEWRILMEALDFARNEMNILILAHSHVKSFHDPLKTESYDRYQLKLHSQQSCSLWKEYVDALFFANHQVYVKNGEGMKKTKAFGDGERVLHTQHSASFDAKNRYGLDSELNLDPQEVLHLIDTSMGEKAEYLYNEILELTKQFEGTDLHSQMVNSANEHKQDPVYLRRLLDRITLKIGELNA